MVWVWTRFRRHLKPEDLRDISQKLGDLSKAVSYSAIQTINQSGDLCWNTVTLDAFLRFLQCCFV